MSTLWDVCLKLPNNDSKRNHVEVERHVGASEDLVDTSTNLVEARAIPEWSWVLAITDLLFVEFRWMMYNA